MLICSFTHPLSCYIPCFFIHGVTFSNAASLYIRLLALSLGTTICSVCSIFPPDYYS